MVDNHAHHGHEMPVTEGTFVHTNMGDHGGHGGHNGHGGHSGHGDQSGNGSGMHMTMTFHFSTSAEVLFDSWKFDSVGGLIGSMVGIFFMAALYEGLKYYREYLFWKTYNALQYRAVEFPAEKGVVNEDNQVVQEYLFWKTYNALQYRAVEFPAEKGVVNEDNQVVHLHPQKFYFGIYFIQTQGEKAMRDNAPRLRVLQKSS
ncbi:hypothetical protein FQA39_LY17139 [Lamprigera yunnana]|nr:hypothetical protein FQA39_LY17139 [Lamprigera yunnana]